MVGRFPLHFTSFCDILLYTIAYVQWHGAHHIPQSVYAYTPLLSSIPPYHRHTSLSRDRARTISACFHEFFSRSISIHRLPWFSLYLVCITTRKQYIQLGGMTRTNGNRVNDCHDRESQTQPWAATFRARRKNSHRLCAKINESDSIWRPCPPLMSSPPPSLVSPGIVAVVTPLPLSLSLSQHRRCNVVGKVRTG